MKKIVVVFVLAAFAGSALAADVMQFKRGVKFNHKIHQDTVKDCTKCHAKAEGGKIEGFGKEYAHKSCKGCHAEFKKGPSICKDCHKQS
ncbi:MAG: cytochrome c3 family protein [Desulfuromonadaceae bacterium]|nr:cytochrome c3 family protein [Desulfuromonadaceae bacterium]